MDNKTQSEIERASALWFACSDAVQRGEKVPNSVFLLDLSDLTDDDFTHMQNAIERKLPD